ncbi:MAG: copper amine oxidase N-terminal domain-containing protein [Erysipelotrichia bacterium]|nr:copper amine oxidase N-terminal domain-containing protein [Erysipelotrichia bacterium]
MKEKIISLLSALALTAQIMPCALADSDVKVYVNDTEMVTDAPIIIENDRTLVPIRAISEYLDYNVDWDSDTQTVVISKNLTTLKFTIGNLDASLEFLYYDGTENDKVSLEVAPRIINDTTYIPLSGFKSAFHFNIDWNDNNKEVHIASYKQGDFSQLIKFGIISDNDLSKDGYITVAEALNTFSKFSTITPDESMLSAWYSISKLEPTDDTYDSAKISSIILKKDLVLTHNDILNLNFADNLTNLQVLTWVMRLTQSFYGCTRYIKDTDTYSTDDIYTAVYYRGLINSTDTSNAQSPISRADFYDLLNKVLFCSYVRGGYGGSYTTSLYETLQKQQNSQESIEVDE